MLNAGYVLLYIKVIKCEQKLVLMMMWRMWELIWLIMMDACLARMGKKRKFRERANQQNALVCVSFFWGGGIHSVRLIVCNLTLYQHVFVLSLRSWRSLPPFVPLMRPLGVAVCASATRFFSPPSRVGVCRN